MLCPLISCPLLSVVSTSIVSTGIVSTKIRISVSTGIVSTKINLNPNPNVKVLECHDTYTAAMVALVSLNILFFGGRQWSILHKFVHEQCEETPSAAHLVSDRMG